MMFKTPFQGYSVKFSPFEDGRIAVATSQNFGIIGNGRQHVLQVRCLHGGLDAGMFASHSLQARCSFMLVLLGAVSSPWLAKQVLMDVLTATELLFYSTPVCAAAGYPTGPAGGGGIRHH